MYRTRRRPPERSSNADFTTAPWTDGWKRPDSAF
jgi:hypothetical protein